MNKKISITTITLFLVVATISLLFSACSKTDPSLGALPVASFKSVPLTPTSDTTAANIELINTTPTPCIAYWNIEGVGKFTGDTVQIAFVFADDYPVELTVVGQGGTNTITQSVNVAEDNPYAVGPTTILGVLTGAALGNTERTWTPSRIINTALVYDNYDNALGAIDAGGGAWWGFGPGEIATDGTGRDGYLDDKYTFTFGKVGQFIYDDNNSIYLDSGGSGWTGALPAPWNGYLGTVNTTSPGTYTSIALFADVAPAFKTWASGTFTYSISPAPAGAKQLGTITVNGTGAHLGLPDKTNAGDMSTAITVNSITYDVLRISTDLTDAATGATYDEIIIGVQDNGIVWTYIFRSNN